MRYPRKYGVLDGIKEAKQLLADMMEVPKDNIVIFGNSSLNIMYDTIARSMTHGVWEVLRGVNLIK